MPLLSITQNQRSTPNQLFTGKFVTILTSLGCLTHTLSLPIQSDYQTLLSSGSSPLTNSPETHPDAFSSLSRATTNWEKRFFSLANLVSGWSEDNSRRVGAVIVGRANEVRSIGFNGLARGVSPDDKMRFSKDDGEKYYWFEHAERNAIFNAARVGTSTSGCSIYSTLFPCSDCVRAIIQSGITEINTFSPPEGDQHFRRSFEVSIQMVLEADVLIRFFDNIEF